MRHPCKADQPVIGGRPAILYFRLLLPLRLEMSKAHNLCYRDPFFAFIFPREPLSDAVLRRLARLHVATNNLRSVSVRPRPAEQST